MLAVLFVAIPRRNLIKLPVRLLDFLINVCHRKRGFNHQNHMVLGLSSRTASNIFRTSRGVAKHVALVPKNSIKRFYQLRSHQSLAKNIPGLEKLSTCDVPSLQWDLYTNREKGSNSDTETGFPSAKCLEVRNTLYDSSLS